MSAAAEIRRPAQSVAPLKRQMEREDMLVARLKRYGVITIFDGIDSVYIDDLPSIVALRDWLTQAIEAHRQQSLLDSIERGGA
jgi:hypothetical protein